MWKYPVFLALVVVLALSVVGALAQSAAPVQPLVSYESGQCRALVPYGTEWHASVQEAAAGQLENVFYDVVDVAVSDGVVWIQVAAAETGGSAFVNTNEWSVELDVSCIFNSGLGDDAAPDFHVRYPFGTCLVLYVPPSTRAYPPTLDGAETGMLTEQMYIVWDAVRSQDADWLILHDTSNRQRVAATVRELTERVDTSRAVVTPGCVAVPGLLAGE
jgi:hypothetical protein